jgi:hypothetical protein
MDKRHATLTRATTPMLPARAEMRLRPTSSTTFLLTSHKTWRGSASHRTKPTTLRWVRFQPAQPGDCSGGAHKMRNLQAESGVRRRLGSLLPCRRSWVRVPSAASKALHMGAFLEPKTLLRNYAEGLGFDCAPLIGASACKQRSSGSVKPARRACRSVLEPGTIGDGLSASNDRRSDRRPPHGSTVSA